MNAAPGSRRRTPGPLPGTYVLLMRLAGAQSLAIGRLGLCELPRGWYLYVGSAFGPGGVAARCRHHRRISPRPRWHVDYLRAVAPLRAIWFSHAAKPLEHVWASRLARDPALTIPIPGFGASDCDCATHLFHARRKPDVRHFSALLASQAEDSVAVGCEIM